MNYAQVAAKARRAMKRREDEIEQDETESGEINLIPYLDIVTNIMLFLLASVATGLILGHINTTLPEYAPATAAGANDPQKPPNEQDLQLVVSVTKNELILWSLSGLEGTIAQPKIRLSKLPETRDAQGKLTPAYDYAALNAGAKEIVMRRWPPGGPERLRPTMSVILQADNEIPYEIIIATMDALRSTPPAKDPAHVQPGDDLLMFPDIHFSLGFE